MLQLFTALPACGKIARSSKHLLNSEHRSKLSTGLLVGWAMIVEVQFVEKSGAVASNYAACKCCLSIFTKIKLLIVNRDSSMVFSVVVLLLKYNFCLRNIFRCPSSKYSLGWDFVSIFALSESSKTYYFLTVFTLLLQTMVSMSHIFC